MLKGLKREYKLFKKTFGIGAATFMEVYILILLFVKPHRTELYTWAKTRWGQDGAWTFRNFMVAGHYFAVGAGLFILVLPIIGYFSKRSVTFNRFLKGLINYF